MKLLTKWLNWWVAGRDEHKFHCDLILEPGERIEITSSSGHRQMIYSDTYYTKVHISASWEHRMTEFVEDDYNL